MKALSCFATIFSSCALALTATSGPVPMSSGKEMKQVAPAPVPECNWSGFYVGLVVGGQWGHSEDRSLDGYAVRDPGNIWGYDESGVLAGGQVGYNFQWNWLVIGAEADLGYMNLEGRGTSRFDDIVFASDTRGETDSDFYTTIRGRLGFARIPQGAIDFLKYPCTVDGRRFEKATGFEPGHNLRETIRSLRARRA